ncbi:MAG: hypothetical protein OEV94_11945 [Deltaproteobacteria bacterium]|nr:hypothetical protein [Deltaproteobacteria bacterium]
MTLHLMPDEIHGWWLNTREVATGFGVTEETIRKHKSIHADELAEGKHWGVNNIHTLGGLQKATLWTKRGVVRLGFFIKSERAKRFRDWAEDLVLKEIENQVNFKDMEDIQDLKMRVTLLEIMMGKVKNRGTPVLDFRAAVAELQPLIRLAKKLDGLVN